MLLADAPKFETTAPVPDLKTPEKTYGTRQLVDLAMPRLSKPVFSRSIAAQCFHRVDGGSTMGWQVSRGKRNQQEHQGHSEIAGRVPAGCGKQERSNGLGYCDRDDSAVRDSSGVNRRHPTIVGRAIELNGGPALPDQIVCLRIEMKL